jgi:hypothetical protein
MGSAPHITLNEVVMLLKAITLSSKWFVIRLRASTSYGTATRGDEALGVIHKKSVLRPALSRILKEELS